MKSSTIVLTEKISAAQSRLRKKRYLCIFPRFLSTETPLYSCLSIKDLRSCANFGAPGGQKKGLAPFVSFAFVCVSFCVRLRHATFFFDRAGSRGARKPRASIQ